MTRSAVCGRDTPMSQMHPSRIATSSNAAGPPPPSKTFALRINVSHWDMLDCQSIDHLSSSPAGKGPVESSAVGVLLWIRKVVPHEASLRLHRRTQQRVRLLRGHAGRRPDRSAEL